MNRSERRFCDDGVVKLPGLSLDHMLTRFVGAITGAVVAFGCKTKSSRWAILTRAAVVVLPVLVGTAEVAVADPSAQAQAIIAGLKSVRTLEKLDRPVSCRQQGMFEKGFPIRDSCTYESDGIKVSVSWVRSSGRLSGVGVWTEHAKDADPTNWTDLASVVSILCWGTGRDRAEAAAHAVWEGLSAAAWTKWDGGQRIAVDSRVPGAQKYFAATALTGCELSAAQVVQGEIVRSILRFRLKLT
jgi:hypothetical protein